MKTTAAVVVCITERGKKRYEILLPKTSKHF